MAFCRRRPWITSKRLSKWSANSSPRRGMSRVVIIGGGISGLAAAYYLNKAGIRSVIVEREPRLGGVIRTDNIEGCVVEQGPDSFLSTKPAARELAEELGLGSELIGSNDHQRITYIWRNGRLIRLP